MSGSLSPSPSPSPSGLPQRVLAAQRRIFRAMERGQGAAWCQCELTMAQLKALLLLDGDRPRHLGDVAGALDIGLPTASHLVGRLVRRGLVKRRDDPSDRRFVLLERTAAGEDLVDRLRRGGRARMSGWLLRLDLADLAALARGVEALAAVAESTPVGSGPPEGEAVGRGHRTASDVTASEVTATDVTATDVTATDVTATDVTATDVTAADGTATDVTATDVTAADRTATDVTATDVTATDVTAADGTASDGTASDGTATDGTATDVMGGLS